MACCLAKVPFGQHAKRSPFEWIVGNMSSWRSTAALCATSCGRDLFHMAADSKLYRHLCCFGRVSVPRPTTIHTIKPTPCFLLLGHCWGDCYDPTRCMHDAGLPLPSRCSWACILSTALTSCIGSATRTHTCACDSQSTRSFAVYFRVAGGHSFFLEE